MSAAEAAFHLEHDRHFGHASPGAPVEVLAVRLGAVGRTAKPDMARRPAGREADARRGERLAWDPAERALALTPVWDGTQLEVSCALAGPAIVTLESTTIVVQRGFTLDVDAYGAFAIHTAEPGAEPARRLEGVGFG